MPLICTKCSVSTPNSFTIVYLELTWLREIDRPYDLGDNELHLACKVDDYEAARKRPAEMGVICCENALPQPSLVIIMRAAYSVSCGLP